MELQWPLIIFTTLIAWSAGLFATQCVFALKGKGAKAQFIAWICSAVLLVIGGVAVLFHLQHWERIFNGFGHLTSGITHELIAIVVLALVALVYLVMLRKSEGGTVPSWIAIVGIAVSAVLVIVMAHSYMMAARPAWNSILWVAAVLGNACILGPATMVVLCTIKGEDTVFSGQLAFVGAAVNAVTTVAYAIALQMSSGAFSEVGYYFDPTHPTNAMLDASAVVAAQAPLLWAGAVGVGALLPLVIAFFAKKKGDAGVWKISGAVIAGSALVGAMFLRVAFYGLGLSIFTFY